MTDTTLVADLATLRSQLTDEIAKRVVGQEGAVDALLTAVFARGHALLVGVPGLAKTLLVSTLGEALGWSFRRIQFTPDLMPSDITGTEILQQNTTTGERELRFVPGPVFGNLILADEINRTPPKTQAALLEAMQEHAVTTGGVTRPLPEPFFVLATQNPIEQEGTYHLPEAQLDRFLLGITLGYPSEEDERRIATIDVHQRSDIAGILDVDSFEAYTRLVDRIPVPDVAVGYAVSLVRASRPDDNADKWVKANIAWGAGPRASQHLLAAAKANAALHGETACDIAAIRRVAPWVLGHRIVPSFHAAGTGIDGAAIVAHLIRHVKP